MYTNQRSISNGSSADQDDLIIRDIHALTPPHPPTNNNNRRREAWETSSHISESRSSTVPSENFTTMSREFNALVLAGSSTLGDNGSENEHGGGGNNNINHLLSRIGEDDNSDHHDHNDDNSDQEINPLAIVPDNYNHKFDPVPSPGAATTSRRNTNTMLVTGSSSSSSNNNNNNNNCNNNQSLVEDITVNRVKREETESKISAWQNAKISKINNRFKREDAVINGWEGEQVQKSTSWMKKVEGHLYYKWFLTTDCTIHVSGVHAEKVGGEKSKST
ncbi:remorin 4.1-like isoform X2 [Papaver somniferum]|uniref:remorin 4.1-like isoform X2 n=1 Tax=Papaver somniferum TaxID=3469 RepID=UPI000E705B7E|nr:remorin 4.1-like isoform X2 [Papaver somniferum]